MFTSCPYTETWWDIEQVSSSSSSFLFLQPPCGQKLAKLEADGTSWPNQSQLGTFLGLSPYKLRGKVKHSTDGQS